MPKTQNRIYKQRKGSGSCNSTCNRETVVSISTTVITAVTERPLFQDFLFLFVNYMHMGVGAKMPQISLYVQLFCAGVRVKVRLLTV